MAYIIGIPKEIKAYEKRVALIPHEVKQIIDKNFTVYVETNAGAQAGYTDQDYINIGAIICDSAQELFKNANVIVKVKEPQEAEYSLITKDHIIFSFFHFAGSLPLLQAMLQSNSTCIAYETIQTFDTYPKYPILAPMSVIAGEQSMINADKYIDHNPDDHICIIGAGNVGQAAAYKAKEFGYKNIHLIDKNYAKLSPFKDEGFHIYEMTDENLAALVKKSKIVVGSIYNTGEKAKKLISTALLDTMQDDSIIMDVAIDQGGMTDYSQPTTVTNPIVMYKNIMIYCVPNIPSQAPTEASIKISQAIYPYLCTLLDANSVEDAMTQSKEFASGVNILNGQAKHSTLTPLTSLLSNV